jgi:hypothetical protein
MAEGKPFLFLSLSGLELKYRACRDHRGRFAACGGGGARSQDLTHIRGRSGQPTRPGPHDKETYKPPPEPSRSSKPAATGSPLDYRPKVPPPTPEIERLDRYLDSLSPGEKPNAVRAITAFHGERPTRISQGVEVTNEIRKRGYHDVSDYAWARRNPTQEVERVERGPHNFSRLADRTIQVSSGGAFQHWTPKLKEEADAIFRHPIKIPKRLKGK